MSIPRSASYVLGFLAFAGICAAWASGGFKSPALAGPRPRLLYVSDPKLSELAIFSLPALAQIGTITGLVQPHGLCSDDKGNVWATSTGSRQFRVRSRRRQSHQRLERPDRIPVRLRRRPAPQ